MPEQPQQSPIAQTANGQDNSGQASETVYTADAARAAIQDALSKLPRIGKPNLVIKSGDPLLKRKK